MEETEIEKDNDNEENDQLDQISDEKLWDILDGFSNEKKTEVETNKTLKFDRSCKACKSKNIVFTSGKGSYVCGDCGAEGQDILDETPEWNNYEDGKIENGRCGAPINTFFPKSSLGTTINAAGYSKVKMLRNWGQVPYRERSLGEVLNDIDNKCKKYKITKAVIDNAKILYKNIREMKHDIGINKGKNVIIRGINRKQIIAACVYFGSILQKCPRSTKEIADIFGLELKQITKGCRKFLEIMKDNFIIFDIKPSHGSDFVERFGSKIKLNKNTIQTAKIISENTTKLDIASDHQATSIAAASILLAANILEQNISKKNISEVFEISDVTITKTYKKIYPYQKIVMSDELTNNICHKMNLKCLTDGLNNDINQEKNLSINEKQENNKSEILIGNTKEQREFIETNNTNENKQLQTTETETDRLLKKLNLGKPMIQIVQSYTEPIMTDTLTDIQIDESDIIKKDNTLSKQTKLILLQQEKERRKDEKKKIKEEKEKIKQQQKELNKLKKIQAEKNTEILTEISKKKRGRPKKIVTVTNISVS